MQIRVREQLTLVARIRPTGPTPGVGVIVCREGEYLLGRWPDGTIRWALGLADPGWQWIETGAIARDGQWTHVVLTFDGFTVRMCVNGAVLRDDDFRSWGRSVTPSRGPTNYGSAPGTVPASTFFETSRTSRCSTER